MGKQVSSGHTPVPSAAPVVHTQSSANASCVQCMALQVIMSKAVDVVASKSLHCIPLLPLVERVDFMNMAFAKGKRATVLCEVLCL